MTAEYPRAEYPAQTREWALEEYEKSRHNYASRAECVAALALSIGAHENTVARWIKGKYGSSRRPAADEVAARLRAAEEEIIRLRSENHSLSERLAAHAPRSIGAESMSAAAL
uniref:transposase n=1 Tax=Cryobacterium sp. TaxID=1926290 RepID=UPI00159A6DCF|nr:transposase [Cryobacterium sp.]QJS06131.1 transposase [Cryobacterium sp.]